MQPRFMGRLSLADGVTVANAAVGFLAVVAATFEPSIAARLILLGAIADGLDGVVARKFGSSAAGHYLDALADVATFVVAPAMLIAMTARGAWSPTDSTTRYVLAIAAGTAFVAMGVVRLGLYTAYDSDDDATEGVQTTLAATVIAAFVLSVDIFPGDPLAPALAVLGAAFAALMVTEIRYPDLHPQDAAVMGIVQALAIALTGFAGSVFAFGLLVLAVAYLVFAPWLYWDR
jgi:CDP-diacylglycerol--serine O-phosphatidyltransferase